MTIPPGLAADLCRPGEGGDRDTVFACAKQFVGQQTVKQTKLTTPERRGG